MNNEAPPKKDGKSWGLLGTMKARQAGQIPDVIGSDSMVIGDSPKQIPKYPRRPPCPPGIGHTSLPTPLPTTCLPSNLPIIPR